MALDLDGITVANHGDPTAIDGAAALSYGVWVRRTAVDTTVTGITKGTLFLLYVPAPDAGDDIAGGQSGVWEYHSTSNFFSAANQWYYISATYDGSLAAADRWKMWADGAALTLSGTTPGATLAGSVGSNLQVGMNTTTPSSHILGPLKMWTAALTEAEHQAEWLSYEPKRVANLLLWSNYDEGTAVPVDYSGNGFHSSVVTNSTDFSPLPRPFGDNVIDHPRSHRREDRDTRAHQRQLGPLVPRFQEGV